MSGPTCHVGPRHPAEAAHAKARNHVSHGVVRAAWTVAGSGGAVTPLQPVDHETVQLRGTLLLRPVANAGQHVRAAQAGRHLALLCSPSGMAASSLLPDVDEAIAWRKRFLVDYQDEAYARQYVDFVEHVRSVERSSFPGRSELTRAVAKYWFETLAGLPCDIDIASEFRYRQAPMDPHGAMLVISQSGETADTLAALKHAKSLGMTKTLAICNVPESAIVRESALRLITRAGPEIGVASTKAFTTQLAALALLALTLAKINGRLGAEQESGYLTQLRHLPVAVAKVLELEPEIEKWAQRFAGKHHALFLGRGSHWPIAMEGALKLKEISYIHAESYAAGELKHGPLALVDKEMPVIAVAPADELLEKLKSNLQEVRARGGELYVFADAGSEIPESEGVHILHMPEHYGMLSPILHVIPLQLLSYHAALVKGTDVDKPRNLAKSVTVE